MHLPAAFDTPCQRLQIIQDWRRSAEAPSAAVAPPTSGDRGCSPEVNGLWGRLRDVVPGVLARAERIIVEVVGTRPPQTPAELADLEARLHQRFASECLDPVTAAVIQSACEDPVVVERAERIARGGGYRPQKATQTVRITLLGGTELAVRASYFLRRDRHKKGGKKARGESGNGIYPVLAVLGIHARTTPALMSEVGRLAAQGTFLEAQANLAIRGVKLATKQIRCLTRHLARKALDFRDYCLKQAGLKRTWTGSPVAKGKRIGIEIDGGRLRTRVRSGSRRKSGHHGFTADWKEPKVFAVFELDKRGRKSRKGFVRYDGTLGGADRAFELLATLLRDVGAEQASLWVIAGDGAEWIWNRVGGLAEQVGFERSKVVEVLDFYHAVEHVNGMLEHVPAWTAQRKAAWRACAKVRLRDGDIVGLIDWIERTLCQEPSGEAARGMLDYLRTHRDRMQYAEFKRRRLPRGSGVIESGVRRIINLRLKGCGIFWGPAEAEGIIHLRAQLLSNRWSDFMHSVLRPLEVAA